MSDSEPSLACEILEIMPFTLSHAAAIWPFQRTRLELSALIAGSFAPDFSYFFFLSGYGLYAHSLQGMFVLDLPLSLVGLWLFHAFVKYPFSVLLPKGIRARLKPRANGFTFWPPARLALIVVSILVGLATHIFWDSFTHPFYWPYRHLSFLRMPIHLPIEGDVHMYKVLQDGSTILGLAVVAVWIGWWYRATEPGELPTAKPYSQGQIRVITIVVPVLALLGGMFKSYKNMGIPDLEFRSVLHFAVITAIAAITFFMAGLLICGLMFRRRDVVTAPVSAA